MRRFLWGGFLATNLIISHASALNFVKGSKCEAKCSDSAVGTIHENVACLDDQYDQLPAKNLRECISCQLNSTAVDAVTNTTDVQWGLFHLRYALANCMFAYPEERASVSSPCQITCAPLKRALISGIANSTTTTNYSPDLGFCTDGPFDHSTLNNCAFCYSFIPHQLIFGNFLQALHVACFSPPAAGKAFYPDATAIFNRSTITGPTGQNLNPSSNKLTGQALVLAIVLPTIVGALFIIGACCGCWYVSRKRRGRKAATEGMHKLNDGQFPDHSPVTMRTLLPRVWPRQEPAREMRSISVAPEVDKSATQTSLAQHEYRGHALGQWSSRNRIDMSTNQSSVGRQGEHNGDRTTTNDTKDPYLHERYLGGDR